MDPECSLRSIWSGSDWGNRLLQGGLYISATDGPRVPIITADNLSRDRSGNVDASCKSCSKLWNVA